MEHITKDIIRIRVPFDNIYTSVFVIITDAGAAVMDCATTEADVEEYVLPALAELGVVPSLILTSHFHGDHMGGLPFLAARFPEAEIAIFDPTRVKDCTRKKIHSVKDGEMLLGCLRILHLPGHSPDSIAVLDERSKTLLSFDCLQAFGIGRYGTSVSNVADYLTSVERTSKENMEILVTSHEYVPTGSMSVGKTEIAGYLAECRKAIQQLCDFVRRFPDADAETLAERFHAEHPALPTVSRFTMSAIARHLKTQP